MNFNYLFSLFINLKLTSVFWKIIQFHQTRSTLSTDWYVMKIKFFNYLNLQAQLSPATFLPLDYIHFSFTYFIIFMFFCSVYFLLYLVEKFSRPQRYKKLICYIISKKKFNSKIINLDASSHRHNRMKYTLQLII